MIFGFLALKSFSEPIFRSLSLLEQILEPKKGFSNVAILVASRDMAHFEKMGYFENRKELDAQIFRICSFS